MSILQHLVAVYKLWFELKQHLRKSAKYTLGEKIDNLFIETLELIFRAQYAPQERTLPILEEANTKFDLLKFFLMTLWETKGIETKHYVLLSEKLETIGKMLGGWLRRFTAAAPPNTKK